MMVSTGLPLYLAMTILPGLGTSSIFPGDTGQLVSALRQRLHFDSVFVVTTSYKDKLAFEEQYAVGALLKELHLSRMSTRAIHKQVDEGYHGLSTRGRQPRSLVHRRRLHRPHFIVDRISQGKLAVFSPLILLTSNNVGTRTFLEGFWVERHNIFQEDDFLWLLLLDGPSITDYFNSVRVPLGIQFLVAERQSNGFLIMEVFGVGKNYTLQIHPFGHWDGNHLNWRSESFFHRRNNLQGNELFVVSDNDPPYTDTSLPDFPRRVGGTVGAVWQTLEHRLNFTSMFHFSNREFLHMGNLDSNFEAAIGDISTAETKSANMMMFTAPLFFITYRLYMRQPEATKLQWGSFLSPFSLHLWLAVVAVLVIASFCLAILRRHHTSSPFGFVSESIVTAVGVFCLQGSDIFTSTTSDRIAILTMYVTGITLMTGYSADIIATLTDRSPPLPFYDIDGILDDKNYKFGMIADDFDERIFQNSKDRTSQRLYEVRFSFLENLESAVKQMCTRNIVVHMRQHLVHSGRYEQPCTVVPLAGYSLRMGTTIFLRQLSPYGRILSYHINGLRRTGVLQRLKRGGYQHEVHEEEEGLINVTLWNIAPIISLLVTGMLASVFILLLECFWCKARVPLYHRYKRYRQKKA